MKNRLHKNSACRALVVMLFVFVCLTGITGQDSIVVYSDTTSALQNAEADDSIYASSTASAWPDDSFPDEIAGHGMLEFMSHILGLTGIIAILAGVLIFLFPLIAIGLIIYLIYRLSREKQRNTEHCAPSAPEDEVSRALRYKEAAIRRACWGAGLLLVEWIADIADLLYIIGIVLLCMAAYSWMNAQIRK